MHGVQDLDQLLLVYATYVIATASPGPSNMAIMGVAMSRGRGPAFALALGVIAGSMSWAILAATGVSAVLASYADALTVIRIAGGLYLLYLACKSAKSALSSAPQAGFADADSGSDLGMLFRRGMLLHLTNPKAVLAWIAIMSIGVHAGAPGWTLPAIVGGCGVLGVLIFGGYALVFSTARMTGIYRKARRWIEGALAAIFGYAGFRLLVLTERG